MASTTAAGGSQSWPVLSSCPSNVTFQPVRNHPKKFQALQDIFQKFVEPNYGSQAALAKKIGEGEGVKCRLLSEEDKPVGILVYKADLSDKYSDAGVKNGLAVKHMCLTKPLKYGPKGFQSLLLDKTIEIAKSLAAKCIYLKIREDDVCYNFFLQNKFAVAKTFTSPSSIKTHLLVLSLTAQAPQQEAQHVKSESSAADPEKALPLEQPREDATTLRTASSKRTRSASPIARGDETTQPSTREEARVSLSKTGNRKEDTDATFQTKRARTSDPSPSYQETDRDRRASNESWLSLYEAGPTRERSSSSSSSRSDDSSARYASFSPYGPGPTRESSSSSNSRRSDDSSTRYSSLSRRERSSSSSDRRSDDSSTRYSSGRRGSESRESDRSNRRETSKFFPMTLKNIYLQMIKDGSKTIEGRINSGIFATRKAGDCFKFYNQQDSVNCEITKVAKYKSFAEMLKTEGYKALVPNERDLEAAIRAYERIPGYPEKAAKFGVVALHLKKVE